MPAALSFSHPLSKKSVLYLFAFDCVFYVVYDAISYDVISAGAMLTCRPL